MYKLEKRLFEGKTKIGYSVKGHPDLVLLRAKDDITAGDGKKHDVLSGKAVLATKTTCNVFTMLRDRGVPVAYRAQLGTNQFLAVNCQMLPYEVVVRREAHGSFLKRHPDACKGQRFDGLLVEFFLKTSERQWRGKTIPCDDPLMVLRNGSSHLYLPDVPESEQHPFMEIDGYPPRCGEMQTIALETFALLEQSWQRVGCRLVDFKVEFGIDAQNNLLLADVIDNDSWRVIEDGAYIDKQAYRDNGALNDVLAKYERVAELSNRFTYIY